MSSLSLLWLSVLAASPTPNPNDHPAVLYDEGTTHYRQGHFRQAIVEFLEADHLRPSPALAYDTAQTYEKLGDPEHAAEYYRVYLERQPGAADRPVVEATLHNLDSWIELRRTANTDPGAQFRKLGLYTLAVSAGVGAIGFALQVVGDGEPRNDTTDQSIFHTSADVLFVTAGVGLISAGVLYLLGTTSYATKQTAIALLPAPGGLALAF